MGNLRKHKPTKKDYGRRPQGDHHESHQEMMREKTVFQRQNESPYKHSELEKPYIDDKDYQDRERTWSPPDINFPPFDPLWPPAAGGNPYISTDCSCRGDITLGTPGMVGQALPGVAECPISQGAGTESKTEVELWAGVGEGKFRWELGPPNPLLRFAAHSNDLLQGSHSFRGGLAVSPEQAISFIDLTLEQQALWAANAGCPSFHAESNILTFNCTWWVNNQEKWGKTGISSENVGCISVLYMSVRAIDDNRCFAYIPVILKVPNCIDFIASGPNTYDEPGGGVNTISLASSCDGTEWSTSANLGAGGNLPPIGRSVILSIGNGADCSIGITARNRCADNVESIVMKQNGGAWGALQDNCSRTCGPAGFCLESWDHETEVNGVATRYFVRFITWPSSGSCGACGGACPGGECAQYPLSKIILVDRVCGGTDDCSDDPNCASCGCAADKEVDTSYFQEWDC